MSLKCSIHLSKVPNDLPIRLFNEARLTKCQEILNLRKINHFKYQDFVLPANVNEVDGYHVTCYRSFTAMKKIDQQSRVERRLKNSARTSVANEEAEGLNTGNDLESDKRNEMCIICGIKQKKTSSVNLKLCLASDDKIKEVLPLLHENVLDEVVRKLTLSEDIMWHPKCRNALKVMKPNVGNAENNNFLKLREAHQKAFAILTESINEEVVETSNIGILTIYHSQYMLLISEICELNNIAFGRFRPTHLQNKLEKYFGETIEWHTLFGQVIFHIKDLNISNVTKKVLIEQHFKQIALNIRKEILEIPHKKLLENITLDDIHFGDAELPPLLTSFLKYVIIGPNKRRTDSEKKLRLLKSISSDVVYAVTDGAVKPAKHLELGIALKNLCSCKKILNIVNRLGHCVSYDVAEELETELTYTASNEKLLTPSEMHLNPSLATGLAFDNFDRFVETLNGKDTLHDTVAIIYQNVFRTDYGAAPIWNLVDTNVGTDSHIFEDDFGLTIDNSQFLEYSGSSEDINFIDVGQSSVVEKPHSSPSSPNESIEESQSSSVPHRLRRRRAYEGDSFDVAPYRKKPKFHQQLSRSNIVTPVNLEYASKCDTVWKICLAAGLENIPMWIGFNSKYNVDNLPPQIISYLPQINMSPTSTSVVKETLNMALKIAGECKQKYMHVTYDLAIAKIGFQIQSIERPLYNKIFISLGPFHIMMSLFNAIGKFISECGLTEIVSSAGLLSNGSMVGFLTGKHFNRCKRIHPIIAAAVEILHFKFFLKRTNNTLTPAMLQDLKDIAQYSGPEMIIRETLEDLLLEYESFVKDTRMGLHGKTPQFYMAYVRMIDLYHMLSRSIRTNNVNLFIYCLPEITDLFFAFNHQNYSRWLVLYYPNLFNMDITHPGLRNYFDNGVFTIRRTEKSFCRGPVDLTLEQTINADSANKFKGILNFTNSIGARQRWAKSRFTVTSVISHLLNEIGLSKKGDVRAELKPSRMRIDNKHLQNLDQEFENFINPFALDDKNRLYNICTGKACDENVKHFLLNWSTIGASAHAVFKNECILDKLRFEKPIKRVKTATFANNGLKKKYTLSDGKVKEIRLEKDHFAKLFCLAQNRKLDILSILSFPLTHLPMVFCHIDGTMNKTIKSVLFHIVEKEAEHIDPIDVHATIADGFVILRSIVDVPSRFGQISLLILRYILTFSGNDIHLVFDQYFSPSIKDSEHQRRAGNTNNIPFVIKGPQQHRPHNFAIAFANQNFKTSLLAFLLDDWICADPSIIGKKRIFFTLKNICYVIQTDGIKVFREEVQQLYCEHEEADSRIVFHLHYVSTLNPTANVVIRAVDTDVLVITLGNLRHINAKVWIEAGLTSNNTRRYVSCNSIWEKLGTIFCRALIAFHIFTGTDFTASFHGKGKKRPYVLLKKNIKLQEVFAQFGDNKEVSSSDMLEISEFVCLMYNQSTNSVNQARVNIFNKSYQCNNTNNDILKIKKSVDSRFMPPCYKVLLEKVKRTKYICTIWSNSTLPKPTSLDPLNYGWNLVDNKYSPLWFQGDAAPNSIDDIVATIEDTEEFDNTSDISDSDYDYHPNDSDDSDDSE